MSNETQQPTTSDQTQATFGARLKSMREAKGFDRKDAAAQLRLTEKIIAMMEYERYPADMPITFIKGYIRAYGKLLQIPEHEVKKALAPIKPKPIVTSSVATTKKVSEPLTSGNYFMQFFTYLIIFTIVGLVGMWWYNHPTLTTNIADNQVIQPPHVTTPVEAPQPTNVTATNVPQAPSPQIQTIEQPTVTNQAAATQAAPAPILDNQQAPQTQISTPAPTPETPKSNTDSQTLSLSEQSAKPVSNNATIEDTKNSASQIRVDDNTSANQSTEDTNTDEDSVPSSSNED